jgi:amino acid adenylation domain-containing protein/non-ribosomal peptide synthase protein (TIGR01720 family)
MWERYPFERDEVCCQKTSLSFADSIWEIFGPLSQGVPLVVIPDDITKDPPRLLETLAKREVTRIVLVPSLLRAILDTVEEVLVPRLRYWSSSGEALSPELAERFRERLGERYLINLYGCSEVCADVTYYELPEHLGERRVPIGQPITNTQAFILDAYKQPVPQGVRGEIYIAGAELTRGYLNRPDLTAEKFVPHPYSAAPGALLYRTGDLGRYLPDGNIEYFGRSDYQVKLRGMRIELGEIETMLNEHPAVNSCVVKLVEVLRADGRDGDARLVAYVVADEARGGRPAELHRYLQERLPEHMIPAHFLLLEALPLTPSGKVDRRALPAFDPTMAVTVGYVAPRSPVEELIASIWSEVLGVRRVGVQDNFFELGGHSLLATQVIARMRQVFPVEIALRSIFEQPTIIGLAKLVDRKMRSEQPLDLAAIERVERDGSLPLSFAQQRLWFLNQLEPDNPVYNIPVAINLTGCLNIPALQQSFSEVLRRHESLRTSFSVIDTQAVQVVAPPMPFDLPLSDLSDLEHPEDEQVIQAIANEEGARPFDLGQPPLLRGRLLRLAQEKHVLLVTMHHIVSDGWSMGILIREVGALYTAFSQGKASTLPELPIQYADYSVWQREQLQGELLNEELQYWRRQLSGAPPVLELPADHVRPAVQRYRGGAVKLKIDAETAQALKDLSRREGVTLFMLLLAAFDVLLWRHTGQTEIVVGAPIANRTRTEVEGLIGFFVNTLALRASLKGNPTFIELVRQIREVCLGAYAHQAAPFEKLLEELEPERNLSHTPLFQVMLVLQNAPHEILELPGLKLSSVEIDNQTAKFDLTLSTWETEQGIDGRLEYNRDLFDQSSIDRIVEHFQVLLSSILRNPDQAVARLSLLGADEQSQLVSEWNQTQREYPSRFLHELFEEQVERAPESIALVFEDEVLSYRELNEKANQLAHYLQAASVGPEVLVGVMMERAVEMVVALLAVLKAGAAYVPLDPQYPRERLSFMLEDAGVSILLTQERLLDLANGAEARVVAVDREWSVISQASRENPQSSVCGDSLAYVIYTSGSTGLPKGAMNTHGAISNRVLWMQDAYNLQADDVVLQKTAFSFDVSVWEFFWPLVTGARLVLARAGGQRDSQYLVELIKDCGVTTLHFVPSMLTAFLEEPTAAECHSLRRVMCSGEALTIELQERFFERFETTELHNLYGPTEAAVDVTYWNCRRAGARQSVPIGRPIANTAVYILDEQMQVAPVGVRGELYIGGVAVGRGYWRQAGLTAERFVPHPYCSEMGSRLYRTGDICRWLSDGNIEYLGRSDDQVKIRGHRIELGEVESALRRCAGISECVVIASDDAGSGQRLVAYVVADETEEPESRLQWRRELSEQLPDYMIPAVFMVLTEIPVTVNGKLDRRALPAPEVRRAELSREYAIAQTATEELLVNIWSEVLRVKRIGVHDNFFELGGDSILSLQIVAKAAQAGLHLLPKQLFKYQTIAELATAAEGLTELVTAEQGLITGDVPLTPIQQWFFETQPDEPHHFNQAVLFEVSASADHALIRKALEHLFEHHDALRLRFVSEQTGWRQFHAGLGEAVPFVLEDLSELSDNDQRERVEQTAARIQRSLNLTQGPLARMVLFDMGRGKPGRLLIVIHHLAVDGMSWRILLEDLQTAYEQLSRGEMLRLPRKTTSYKQWAERLEEYAASDQLSKEAGYWLDGSRSQVGRLPLDHETGANLVGSARNVVVLLDEEETRMLLHEVPALYRTHVNDALLTALAQTLTSWSGERRLLVDVEGHGREEIVEGVDLSRTVGWFTTIFPVLLEVGETDDVTTLKSIKKQLREIPQRGIGYGLLRYLRRDEISASLRELPQAEVLFNYLGQLDSVLADSTLLSVAQESSGKTQSEKARRHVLEINASVGDGRLRVTWSYSEHLHQRTTIEWLAAEYADALRRLIDHRQSPESAGFTPADFPGAKLNQQELDTFLTKFKQGRSK